MRTKASYKAHADLNKGLICLVIGLSLNIHGVYTNNEGSGDSAPRFTGSSSLVDPISTKIVCAGPNESMTINTKSH